MISGLLILQFWSQEPLARSAMQAAHAIARPQCLANVPGSTARARRAFSTSLPFHARLIQRPQRPYQFTQLVQLSDGSTFTMRTTNPHPLHRCTRDSRNHVMWQPSEKSLRNVEVDEAGRLAAFRNRFGRGWDAAADAVAAETAPTQASASSSMERPPADSAAAQPPAADAFDSLADLLSGYAEKEEPAKGGGLSAKEQAKKNKKK